MLTTSGGVECFSHLKRPFVWMLLAALEAIAQSDDGRLRVKVTDRLGIGISCTLDLASEGNHYRQTFTTGEDGRLTVSDLRRGDYLLQIDEPGFAPVLRSIRVGATNSVAIPLEPLADPAGNPTLQTELTIQGLPLTLNRSPDFGLVPQATSDDPSTWESAGIPADSAQKAGAVVAVETSRPEQSIHGRLVLSGGSYDSAGGYGRLQWAAGRNTLTATASGARTDHYLNPVVPANYTNAGTFGDFAVDASRDFSPADHLAAIVRHRLSRYEIPNENLQQQAGQIQTGEDLESIGSASWEHVFSSETVLNTEGMLRDGEHTLQSNDLSTPILATQHNSFRQVYFATALSLERGRHALKVGVSADNAFLHENFSDVITDPSMFDPGTPATFSFSGQRPDLEQAAFGEDVIRIGAWTLDTGLRWDHYQLVLNQNAVSPRVSVKRYFADANLILHASYARLFVPPSSNNLLLSSSPAVESLNPNVFRLPVRPSLGNNYEGGLSKGFFGQLRLDLDVYRRGASNYPDYDPLLNTGVNFPIAFTRATIYGADGTLDLPHWAKLSGSLTYSYMVANRWFPVSGGLLLGEEDIGRRTRDSGHIPDAQDQRNVFETRFDYQCLRRFFIAGGAAYGSGLPFDFDVSSHDALEEYGQQVVNRINFVRYRVKPTLSVQAFAGVDLYEKENLHIRFEADGANLNNRLNVIYFGGLFSGNAIGPNPNFGLRLVTTF
jgi:hypothetical protein